MFGIDDLIGGLVGGGMKMLANQQQAGFQQDAFNQQIAQQDKQRAAEFDFNFQQADIARDFSAQQQEAAQQFNADQAQLNRNFQERMSSTAYQRSRADMAAAGLNPILAAGAGGASTPGGGQGSIGALGGPSASASQGAAPRMGDRAALLEGVVTSAAEASRLQPTIDVLRSDRALKLSSADERASAAELNRINATLTDQKVKTEQEATKFVREQTENERRKQGQVFGVNVPYWAQGAHTAVGRGMSSLQDIFSAGDKALMSTVNSAVSLGRGIFGSGTGGM